MCAMMAMSTDGGGLGCMPWLVVGLGCMQIQLINAQSSPQGLASSSGQLNTSTLINVNYYYAISHYSKSMSNLLHEGPQSKIIGSTHLPWDSITIAQNLSTSADLKRGKVIFQIVNSFWPLYPMDHHLQSIIHPLPLLPPLAPPFH